MNKISSLFLLDIGQRAHYLLYKELLQVSKEGQNTKFDQGYENSFQIHTHTQICTHKKPNNILKSLIYPKLVE